MSLKIREIEIDPPLITAPMAGVSTRAFRTIAKEFGAGLVCNEMVSDKALFYGSQKTENMCRTSSQEHPVSFQLFGHDLESILYAARYLDQQTDCDIIDFNMGCPVNKVIKAKAGSYLMKDVDYAKMLVSEIVKAVKKPVTVKMRIGFDLDHINVVEMAKAMEEAGASALVVHGRTRSQMYEGHADWSWIKKVKEAVNIPVIGNGDVKSVEDMKAMLEQTGCDGVMIGRGITGNPFLIQECADYFSGEHHTFTLAGRLDACRRHTHLLAEDIGEKEAIRQMRGLASWYLKGLPDSHAFKEQLNHMQTIADLEAVLTAFEQKQKERQALFLSSKQERPDKEAEETTGAAHDTAVRSPDTAGQEAADPRSSEETGL